METRSVVAYNINKRMQRNQHGGCTMMAMGCFSAEVFETGVDAYRLGRWCWLKVGSREKTTWIMMAYQPSGSRSSNSAGTTVREQHEQYFEARGNLHPARTLFFEQLIAQLVIWKHTNSDIILLRDFNENIYSGRIAKCLSLPDLMLTKQCLRCMGIHKPPTFRDSTVPIDAIFATSGIECINAYILPHKGGVGNHRCFILDFTSSSVIGTKFLNIVRCSARKLYCKLTCLVHAYNTELDMLCNCHKMYQRIHFIYSNLDSFLDEDVMFMMNNWDKELVQFKLHSELNCTKFKSCHIEWSPEVGFWLAWHWLLACVKLYVAGLGTPDPCNLIRDCLRSHLFDPRSVSHSNVMIQIEIARQKLSELAKDAPALHHQHLLGLRKAADDRGDSACSTIILEILTHEQERKKWHRINYTTRPPQGGNPLAVRVQSGPIVTTYDTKTEVVGHTSDHLFQLAYSAPCYCGQIFNNLGFMSDTECSQQILEGMYEYPPDTNIWTKKILQEAQHTFSRMSSAEIPTTISTVDFQQYWKRVDERTSSSFSGVTFSHYKAEASHLMLSAMHAVYLTACMRRSIPLARWGIGLTVLLEMIVGNNFIHKLRAICLLKADFDWINKIIFAR